MKSILLFMGLIFLLEWRTLNALISYIGLTIILAIILAKDSIIQLIGGEYISYIIILVQVGAISVLFGLVLMIIQPTNREIKESNKKRILLFIIYSTIMILLSYNKTQDYPQLLQPSDIQTNNGPLLYIIGQEFYTNLGSIIKLLVITVILLLAIIGLFFIIKIP